jgi:hypothetical protein
MSSPVAVAATIPPLSEIPAPGADEVAEAVKRIEQEQQEELKRFLASPENQRNAANMAEQIIERVGKNWFSLLRFIDKTGLSKEVAYQKLLMLKQFGLVQIKISNYRYAGKNNPTPEFKVTLTKEARLATIDGAIESYQALIRGLEAEREAIK